MPNTLVAAGRQGYAGADVDFETDTIKIVGLSAAYVYSAAHDFHNDLSNIVFTSPALSGKTITDGYCASSPVTITGIASGQPTITQLFQFRDTGTPSTSRLLAYWDTNADDLPISITPNGLDIVITPHSSGWYRL